MKKRYAILLILAVLVLSIFSIRQTVVLTSTGSRLDKVESAYESSQSYLVEKSNEIRSLQSKCDNMTSELSKAKSSLNNLQTNYDGLQINYDRLLVGIKDKNYYYTYVYHDPSYTEMIAFLKADKTDNNPYSTASYNCFDYTRDVIDNAHKNSIRCGYVRIEFEDNTAHACVAFNTIDKGLVFIEPQSDDDVILSVGRPYYVLSSKVKFPIKVNVTHYTVIW